MESVQGRTDVVQALERLRAIEKPINRYVFLRSLKMSSPDVFYALLVGNVHEVLPFIYTPTVGEACQNYHKLPIKSWGLYISYTDRGNILSKLRSCSQQDVSVAVVTDGERILGLGDLGTGGMGISEGKIMLYTVAAGVKPDKCLPICLDVGTNNEELLHDPDYPGLKQKRVTGQDYDEFVDEFMMALKAWRSHMLLQFEDFGNHNAFRLLHRYQRTMCCFNDDIQGTACVCLAGILSAIRASGKPLEQQRVLFLGAGEAGVGIGELISMAIAKKCGIPRAEARKHCFFMDSKGLVCKARTNLQHHKVAFAHDIPAHPDLLSTIHDIKPTVLIGVSTMKSAFTRDVVSAMCQHNDRPIIFPLSNPTSKSECTFEDAVTWSQGRVLFASGSPYQPFTYNGVTLHPAQANNAYIFPAVGHAAVIAQAKALPDEVFLVAAEALAHMSTPGQLRTGWLFPSFDGIGATSRQVMLAVCEYLEREGLAARPGGRSWEAAVAEALWSAGAHQELCRL